MSIRGRIPSVNYHTCSRPNLRILLTWEQLEQLWGTFRFRQECYINKGMNVFRNVHVHATMRPLPRRTSPPADLRMEKALRNANPVWLGGQVFTAMQEKR